MLDQWQQACESLIIPYEVYTKQLSGCSNILIVKLRKNVFLYKGNLYLHSLTSSLSICAKSKICSEKNNIQAINMGRHKQ